jgi:hypothetical protein
VGEIQDLSDVESGEQRVRGLRTGYLSMDSPPKSLTPPYFFSILSGISAFKELDIK